MNNCKNCKYTDEYCASGDCTAQLNKQWYEGTLEKDKYYYAKDSSEGDCIVHIDKSNELTFTGWEVPYKPDQSNILEPFKLRTELLAQVPSYEKWMAAYECQLMENELVTTLKDLLKEIRSKIKTVYDMDQREFITSAVFTDDFVKKIDEVLNDNVA